MKTPAKKARAKAAHKAADTIHDAFHKVEQTKSATQTLAAIADVYDHFLAHKDAQSTVEALGYLHGVRYFDLHVWRVHKAALSAKETNEHDRHAWILSVLLLVTHALRAAETTSEISSVWAFIHTDADAWKSFLAALVQHFILNHRDTAWTLREKSALVQILIQCFAHLEVDTIRNELLQLVSLPMWRVALSASQRQLEFRTQPKLARLWKKLNLDENENGKENDKEKENKNAKTASKRRKTTPAAPADEENPPTTGVTTTLATAFVVALLDDFIKTLATKSDADDVLQYVALVLSLLTDLLGQLPTRRFIPAVLRSKHLVARVRQSPFTLHALETRSTVESNALASLIDRLEHALWFPVDQQTGKSLTTLQEKKEAVAARIHALQLAAFEPEYRETAVASISIASVSMIEDRTIFRDLLASVVRVERTALEALSVKLGVTRDDEEANKLSDEELVNFFVDEYATPSTVALRAPLPTELEIWSDAHAENNGSAVFGTGPQVLFPLLALPKMGLQYLNITDFLQRASELSAVEAANAIRRDLEQAIRPLDAVRSLARNGETVFRGFYQMAVPLQTAFSILEVAKPAIGETCPATVTAEFDIELDTRHDIKAFDQFQKNEVVYLVTLRPTNDEASEAMGFSGADADMASGHFAEDYGVLYVRCAQVIQVHDESGKPIRDDEDENDHQRTSRGRKRTIQVALDGAQYKNDLDADLLGAYEYVNLLVRREPRVNNFKGLSDVVTTTLKSATRDTPGGALPAWLYDLFLGYGDPTSASFDGLAKRNLQAKLVIPLYTGVFVDAAHAVECCSVDPALPVDLVDENDKPLTTTAASGPYSLVYDVVAKTSTLRAYRRVSSTTPAPSTRLTKEQASAVIHCTADGLTIVSGPGRNQALAHAIQNITQATAASQDKILVISRSAAAVDPLLSQLAALPCMNEASVVRLGGGAVDEFSCHGRVDLLLQRRLALLHHVESLAQWMERVDHTTYATLSGSAAYSCENAAFFHRHYLAPLCARARQATAPKDALLHGFFVERMAKDADSMAELAAFVGEIDGVFAELARLQALELLQTPRQRRQVYLMQHARVIGVSFRHVAAQFDALRALGLQWSTVVVQDAEVVGEIDAVLPLLLASASTNANANSVKRFILVGDASTSSTSKPVVETSALRSLAKLDTSLLSRLCRLGVPVIETNAAVESVGVGVAKPPTEPKSTPQKKKKAGTKK